MTEITDPQNIIAVISIFIAILAVYISYKSTKLGADTFKQQKKHDELSVRPICNVGTLQGPLILSIWISNNGVGPMIIKSVETSDSRGNKKGYPMDWIPKEDLQFVWRDMEDTAILNGNKVDILGFNFVPIIDGKPKLPITKDQIKKREEIRGILKELTIRIMYTDIYGNEQPEFKQDFTIFGQEMVG
jgi:hypothetical protein